MNTQHDGHLSAERMQAFLDEELPRRERHLAEEHLASCARCSAELGAWKALFSDLGELGSLRPHEGFAQRVMTQIRVPEPMSLPERVRGRAAALLGLGSTGHIDGTVAQDLVEGSLPVRHAARVRRHLEACGSCADQVEGFATVMSELGSLQRFEPSAAFADQVMARVRLGEENAMVHAPAAGGWLATVRRLVPSTRRAWAALSGAAVTPVVTLGLVAYAVFSHPTLTLEALLSYVSWQVADLAAAGWGTAVGLLARGVGALGLQDLIAAAPSAPLALVAGSTVYSVLVLLALRVLYKNLVAARAVGIGHAQISRS